MTYEGGGGGGVPVQIRSNWQSRVPTFPSFAFYFNLTCQSNHGFIVLTSCQMLQLICWLVKLNGCNTSRSCKICFQVLKHKHCLLFSFISFAIRPFLHLLLPSISFSFQLFFPCRPCCELLRHFGLSGFISRVSFFFSKSSWKQCRLTHCQLSPTGSSASLWEERRLRPNAYSETETLRYQT